MPAFLRLTIVLLCLVVVNPGCASDGGSSSSSKKESDPEKALIQSRRNAFPAFTGATKDRVDLTGYTTLTLIPLENLTDNSKDDDAGESFVDEVEKIMNGRYEGTFDTVRIADAPLGNADEVVLYGYVYDFSKGGGYNYWTGRSKAKFKADVALKNGAAGAVLKSSNIKESGYSDNEDQLEDAAKSVAKMLSKSKNGE